jgi:hypothetical protein
MRCALFFGLVLLGSPAVAGQIHLKYGYSIDAGYWWVVARGDVVRIDGTPRLPADLEWDFKNHTWKKKAGTGGSASNDRWESCRPIPFIGDPESRIDDWLGCLGSSYSRSRNMTVTAGGYRIQHVIRFLGSNRL